MGEINLAASQEAFKLAGIKEPIKELEHRLGELGLQALIAALAEHLSAATPDAPALDASAERGARRREMMRRRRGG